MQVTTFYEQASAQLQKLYSQEESKAIMNWLVEDYLLIKPAHLRIISKELDWTEEDRLNMALERLLKGEPIQYILGYTYFCDEIFFVNEHVLIPRPETEELCQKVIAETKAGMHILDLCCGSGCIGLSVLKNKQGIKLSGIDVSEEALNIARRNARNLLLTADFYQSNLLQPQAEAFLHSLEAQLWVSNPPYISREEMKDMHVNVLEFEPHLALFVDNEDTLLFYKIITRAFLTDPVAQILYFETSEYRIPALETYLKSLTGINYSFFNDMQGKQRMLRIGKNS